MRALATLVAGATFLVPLTAGVTKAVNGTTLPLSFEPNRGQTDPSASYLSKGNGYVFSLSPFGAHIMLRAKGAKADVTETLLGSNASAEMSAEGQLPGFSSYFRGQDAAKWITGLPTYSRVRAKSVYPGIDLVYYGNRAQLEYDFVLSPGADSGAIRMRFDGVTGLKVNASGDLVLSTAAGNITQRRPVVYQNHDGQRKPVEGRFRLEADKIVSFQVANYDKSAGLTIDPVLAFSTFLGGSDTDEGGGITSDAQGNVYVTGVTFSTQYGDGDVFVSKISADGTTTVYTATYGGSYDDYGNSIAVDSAGYAYVTGYTGSADFPVTANAFQNTNYGYNNAFLFRLDPTGTQLIFSTYLGGSDDDRAYALALDSQSYVYVTGGAGSTDFPTSTGAFQQNNRGGLDAFVAKFDNQGNAYWSTFVGGGSDDQAFGIAVDPSGNTYITGETFSDSYPQVNPSFQHSRHGGADAFITEINAAGSGLVYSTFVGGSGDDVGNSIAVDANGTAFITGTTTSSDLPTSGTAVQRSYAGGASDAFVAAYSPNGQQLLFSTYLGSHGADDGNAIALDANDNVYLAGDTNSDQFPVTGDATQPSRAGGFDATFTVLNSAGSQLLFSTFLGGGGDDSASVLSADANGNVYVTGMTSSSNFPISQNATQSQPGGGSSDAFAARYAFSSGSGGAISFARPVNHAAPSAEAVTQQAFNPRPAPTLEEAARKAARKSDLESHFGKVSSLKKVLH